MGIVLFRGWWFEVEERRTWGSRWRRGDGRVYVVEDPAEIEQAMGDPDFHKSQEQAFPPVTVLAGENPALKLVLPSK